MSERILTMHPQGKKGVNILRSKYDQIASYLINEIKQAKEITYQDLDDKAKIDLNGKFDGSISWYVVSVKLDLEARGIIERIPKTTPHKVRMKPSS